MYFLIFFKLINHSRVYNKFIQDSLYLDSASDYNRYKWSTTPHMYGSVNVGPYICYVGNKSQENSNNNKIWQRKEGVWWFPIKECHSYGPLLSQFPDKAKASSYVAIFAFGFSQQLDLASSSSREWAQYMAIWNNQTPRLCCIICLCHGCTTIL